MTIIFSYNKKLLDRLTITTFQLDEYKCREDKILADLGRAGKEICKYAHKVGKLQEENEQLKDERIMLLQHIERSIDNQKVELPREVADAIEKLRSADLSNFGIVHFIDRPNDLKHQELKEPFAILRQFTFLDTKQYLGGCELLMMALVSGYTVATKPEKDEATELLSGVTEIVKKWWFEAPDGRTANVDRLTEDICDYIKQREDNKPPF